MKTRTSTMRALLKQGIVVSPGVYDGLSARMVQKMVREFCERDS